jgi:hypothetical protein
MWSYIHAVLRFETALNWVLHCSTPAYLLPNLLQPVRQSCIHKHDAQIACTSLSGKDQQHCHACFITCCACLLGALQQPAHHRQPYLTLHVLVIVG